MPNFDLFEAIQTQRAIRRFKAVPVPMELVRQALEAAVRAPSGGNQQPWAFVIVTEPERKRRIAALYRQSWDEVYGPPERAATLSQQVHASASYLAEHMAEAPVLVLACVRHDGSPSSLGRGASIYPAVQNFMLAARALGLGTALTTLHKRYEREVKEILHPGQRGDGGAHSHGLPRRTGALWRQQARACVRGDVPGAVGPEGAYTVRRL